MYQEGYSAVSTLVQTRPTRFPESPAEFFLNSSGEEVFPEPTSSYKLGVPKLYDAGGAHLGARLFFIFFPYIL